MKQHRWVLWLLTVVATFVAFGCNDSGNVTRAVTPEGELLSVKGKYTLILLSDETMRRTFGPEWHRLTLYYGSNRAVAQDGERSMVTADLRPLAKGTSILLISGSDWRDLLIPVYALETRQQAMFYVDTTRPSIKVDPPQPRRGEPMLSPDGRLFFR
jgi:hypothetical protein